MLSTFLCMVWFVLRRTGPTSPESALTMSMRLVVVSDLIGALMFGQPQRKRRRICSDRLQLPEGDPDIGAGEAAVQERHSGWILSGPHRIRHALLQTDPDRVAKLLQDILER